MQDEHHYLCTVYDGHPRSNIGHKVAISGFISGIGLPSCVLFRAQDSQTGPNVIPHTRQSSYALYRSRRGLILGRRLAHVYDRHPDVRHMDAILVLIAGSRSPQYIEQDAHSWPYIRLGLSSWVLYQSKDCHPGPYIGRKLAPCA